MFRDAVVALQELFAGLELVIGGPISDRAAFYFQVRLR